MSKSPEERKVYQKAYRAAHREKAKSYAKAYRIIHGERLKIQYKAYRTVHRKELMAKKKAYYFVHREKEMARSKTYAAAHKEEKKIYDILHKYRLSNVAFNILLKNQGGVCAICRKSDWNGRGPHVDHDHISGKVRGILCQNCNAALGMIGDDVKISRAMTDYLERVGANIGINKI